MQKGIGILGLLLLSTCAQAAIDTQLVKGEAASATTLAGRVGEAVMLSVQADDDNDLEILSTVSSDINNQNDYWVLLDWDGTDYKIIKTGDLQRSDNAYLTSYQVSHTEVLLGQQNGKLTTITFTDDVDADNHIVDEQQTQLSDMPHVLNSIMDINTDIKAIINLEGTNQQDYTVICTSNLIHILNNNALEFTLEQGGYCQSGNIDYQKIDDNYDQELITQFGLYFTFDGSEWQEKTDLSSSSFGENFVVANIDDDDADEILSHDQTEQLQSFSPASYGPWVYISSLEDAKDNFNAVDTDGDDIHEIYFDSQSAGSTFLNKVSWDTDTDTHNIISIETQDVKVLEMKRLATSISAGNETNFYLFAAKADTTNPHTQLLTRLSPLDLTTNWQGIYGTKKRSFDVVAKTQNNASIDDHNLIQLEQIQLGVNDYKYAYKFLSASDFSFKDIVEPSLTDNEVISVNSLLAFDFNKDGIDELHSGGQAGFQAQQGFVTSSNLDGTNFNTLDTPSIESITAIFVGDTNLDGNSIPDIIATGKSNGTNSIGIHMLYDAVDEVTEQFTPNSGDTNFKNITAANVKGDGKLEILGLHSQLASYNPNASAEESSFYNLSNLDLTQFTPITLTNREFQYALSSDASGMLHLIEPKDFDILATVKACDSELIALTSTQVSNNIVVALALCEQKLLSWVVEYDEHNLDQGYGFQALTSYEIGDLDTNNGTLTPLHTTEDTVPQTHLFALFNNTFKRLEINRDIGADGDSDGYYNYQDEFPLEGTQWADSDKDGYGDNPEPALNFDPSPNDIDNDGVDDATDPDNNPVNDLDPLNDTDNGLPSFNGTPFTLVTAQYEGPLTAITLDTPTAQDLYDNFNGHGEPTISASIGGIGLSVPDEFTFETNLAPGKHQVIWQAQDVAGNNATTTQEVWVYPSIAFESATQRIGETQSGKVKVVLNGTSPEYPVNVSISVTGGNILDGEVTQDITKDLTVIFAEGETETFLDIDFIDDQLQEDDESIELTIQDTFDSTEIDPSWTIDDENNVTTLTVVDLNEAPVIAAQLGIEQNGLATSAPTNIGGIVTLSVNVADTNQSDNHSYNWNLSSLGLGVTLLPTASFNANTIQPGLYSISVDVSDNGLPRLATTQSFFLIIDYGDSDGDGVKDNIDAFPTDPNEQLDSDGDGVGDKSDAFPDNANEQLDSDGDNVGDKSDAFPDNANEQLDSDGDGVGDNADVFPNDPLETEDSDGDKVGNVADVFPNNSLEFKDTDGDGVGDNADAFPEDKEETVDSDEDGVGDNSDVFPEDAAKSRAIDDQTLEDDGSGALHYLLLLLLTPLMLYRKKS